MDEGGIYKPCAHIHQTTPDPTVDQELMRSIASEYRTLPTFESTAFEHKFVKHYSLQRNERLKCRWRQYRDNIDKKVFAPFVFPESRDLHFYKGTIRFIPSQTISRQWDQRMKLKPGPRVDTKGQAPIPNEMLMRRENSRKEEPSQPAKTGKQNERENEEQDDKKDVKNTKKNKKNNVKKVLKMDNKKPKKHDAKK